MARPRTIRRKLSVWLRRRSSFWLRSIRQTRPRHIRAMLTGRNAVFALGAILIAGLIWFFDIGSAVDPKTQALRNAGVASPAHVIEEMAQDAASSSQKRSGNEQAALEKKRPTQSPDATAPAQDPPPGSGRLPPVKPAVKIPGFDETVEIDVSSRSVGITSSFTGQRIVIFGAVHNSLQASAQHGLYDVVVVVEGVKAPLISRRKSNVAGLWINTKSVHFKEVPSYYTISSSRPIEEISTPKVFDEHQIGFRHVRIEPVAADRRKVSEDQLAKFREALVRLKANEGLYQKHEGGVQFIGKSLFRTTIDLPANVPIGPVVARAYLFRDAELIAKNTAGVHLERQGLEALMHSFAFDYPLYYGLFAVFMAVSAGLAASAVFSRTGH